VADRSRGVLRAGWGDGGTAVDADPPRSCDHPKRVKQLHGIPPILRSLGQEKNQAELMLQFRNPTSNAEMVLTLKLSAD